MPGFTIGYRCVICGQTRFVQPPLSFPDNTVTIQASETLPCPRCDSETMLVDPDIEQRDVEAKCRFCGFHFITELEPGEEDNNIHCPECGHDGGENVYSEGGGVS